MNVEEKTTETPAAETQTKAAKMKGNKRGKKFSAANQPAVRGRKPSRMSEFIKSFNLEDPDRAISKEDAYKLLKHILFCNKSQLEAMARNSDLPVAIVCQIKAIVTDIANGRTETVDKLFDRLYGKSMQPVELSGVSGRPLISNTPMSRKAYEELYNRLISGQTSKQTVSNN